MRIPGTTLLLAVALAACTTPYSQPVVEEGAGFRGVESYLSPDRPVRVVLSHGMCSDSHRASGPIETTNWVGRRARQMADALGLPPDRQIVLSARTYPPEARRAGRPAVERYDTTFLAEDGAVEATFLVWGRHMDAYRENLAYENGSGGGGPGEKPVRAPLNRALKTELMNRCLLDAVVYLGRNGDVVRRDMRAALCDILGGRFREADPPGAAGVKASCTGAEGFGVPTVLLPESLGSTILFEAFTGLEGEGVRAGAGDIRSIFLAANQLPLLRQGSVPAAPPGAAETFRTARTGTDALSDFLALLSRSRERTLRETVLPVELVAITDPNDVLGYRISKEILNDPAITLRNVLVSNAPTYLGLFSNPIEAHRNTERPEVFDLIVRGMP